MQAGECTTDDTRGTTPQRRLRRRAKFLYHIFGTFVRSSSHDCDVKRTRPKSERRTTKLPIYSSGLIWLMTSLYSVRISPSFTSIHQSYSPQAHLQSSHCIVTVNILTHSILPASPGRAQEKYKQSTTTSTHAHCTTS